MSRRWMPLIAIIGLLALALTACGADQVDEETAEEDGAEEPADEGDEAEPDEEPAEDDEEPAEDDGESEVDVEAAGDVDQEMLDAALEEGRVHYWSSIIQPETHENLQEAFLQYYGLEEGDFDVEYTLLSTSDLATRVDEEIDAGEVSADVISTGAIAHAYQLLDEGELLEYDSPMHDDYGPAFEAGNAEEGYWVADGFSLDTPIWNPQFLPDLEMESWWDMLDYDLEGQVMMGDVEGSLTRNLSYWAMRQHIDAEFFEGLAEFDPGFAVRSEDVVQTTVTGEYPFSVGGMPTRGYQVEQAGVDFELSVAYPEEGIVLLPQIWTILNQAPNPNAAKLWIDFILSEEGQRVYQEGEALISGREGFESPSEKWAPPADSIATMDVDWTEATPEVLEEYKEEWREIFR